MAVTSTEERIDPIGSCVGQRGTRIMAVINELGGEKIDVIEWQKDPEKFIANALSPAKISEVTVEDNNTATVLVPEDQLSLAIGKDGRNVRLAANLTGWKIDIKSQAKPAAQNDAEIDAEERGSEELPETEEKPKKKKKAKKVEESVEEVKEESPSEEKPVEEK